MPDDEYCAPSMPRMALLFALFGAMLLTFTLLTVNHRGSADAETNNNPNMRREHFAVSWWLQHGYFHTGGMLVFPDAHLEPQLYCSVAGGYLTSGFILEKIWSSISGGPNWHLLVIHNQCVSLLAAILLGLLGFRLASRFGLPLLPAATLGIVLEAVYFTFPDNLSIYWEMTARGWWLPFVCIFLLADEHLSDGNPHRATTVVQAAAAFLLTYMEHIAGSAFLGSYFIVSLLLGRRQQTLRHLAMLTIIPIIAAVTLFQTQVALAKSLNPQLPIKGRTFMFRSGLDGDTTYYLQHVDIAFRRDTARANFQPPQIRPSLFHWPWLFFTSAAAFVFMMVNSMRGRVPRAATVTVLSMLGAYLIYAAVFSQAIVIHPYYYDMMLFTPLMIVLFIVTPSLIEPLTSERGVMVAAAVFLGIWVSFVQLRIYAITYPPPKQAQKIRGTAEDPCPFVEQWPGVPLPQAPESTQEGRALFL